MARPKRAKGKSPEQIAAERLQARMRIFLVVGLQAEAAALKTSEDIDVVRQGHEREEGGKRVDKDVASRVDAFTALKTGMDKGAFDAARKLETDIRIRMGENDKGRPMERLDASAGKCTQDARNEAGARVDAVLRRIGDRDAWLLHDLIAPRAETTIRFQNWREIVEYITGETHHHCQGAAVRSACANLKAAYDRVDAEAAAEAKRQKDAQRAAA